MHLISIYSHTHDLRSCLMSYYTCTCSTGWIAWNKDLIDWLIISLQVLWRCWSDNSKAILYGSRLEAFGVPSLTWIKLWKIRRKMNKKVSYAADCASAFVVDRIKICRTPSLITMPNLVVVSHTVCMRVGSPKNFGDTGAPSLRTRYPTCDIISNFVSLG